MTLCARSSVQKNPQSLFPNTSRGSLKQVQVEEKEHTASVSKRSSVWVWAWGQRRAWNTVYLYFDLYQHSVSMPIPPAKIISMWACDSHSCFRQSTLWRQRQWDPVTQPSAQPLPQPSFTLFSPVYHRGWLLIFHIWVSHGVVVLSLPQCPTTAPTKIPALLKTCWFCKDAGWEQRKNKDTTTQLKGSGWRSRDFPCGWRGCLIFFILQRLFLLQSLLFGGSSPQHLQDL